MYLKDKFKGALVGTHVGDALGMPVEGQPPELIQMRFGQVTEMIEARMGAGTYTDDTEMMIAVAESLCRVKKIPLHWLEEMEDGEKGRSYIEKLAKKLYDNFLEVNNK